MRLGLSTPLKHETAEEWAKNQSEVGIWRNAMDPDMPVILEHLSSDREYIYFAGYLKKILSGLY